MKFKFAPIIFIVIYSCVGSNLNQNKSSGSPPQEKSSYNHSIDEDFIESIKSNFLYTNRIEHFTVDSIENAFKVINKEKQNVLPPILNDLYRKIIQSNEADSIVNEHTYYLYNIQNVKKGFQITTINTNDSWVNQIILNTYNHQGELKRKYVLAEEGGDQELFVKSESIFINDSTYKQIKKYYGYKIEIDSDTLTDSTSKIVNIL